MALKKFEGINVIPFVDIMLVLFAIVLTTSTLVERHLIPVSLPKSKSNFKEKIKHKNIIISIKKDGNIFYNDKQLSLKKLQKILFILPLDSIININCDKDAKFDNFVKVLDLLKEKSFKNISIITQADD